MSILVTFSLFYLFTYRYIITNRSDQSRFIQIIHLLCFSPATSPLPKTHKKHNQKNTTQKTHKANHLKEISVSALEFIKRLPSIK